MDPFEDPIEVAYEEILERVKDFSRKDYKRMMAAVDLGYQGYQKARTIGKLAEDAEPAEVDEFMIPEVER
jgi:hypothetical protein